MKTNQANLLNALTLILMPLWSYLTYEGTIEKPDQSITALIPLFLGVVLLLCNGGVKRENKMIAHIAVFITLIAPLGFLDIYRVEVLVLLASLMYLSKPK